LATALNLLPVGQLDGGHIAYATLGSRARLMTYATLTATLVLGITVAQSWLFWCFLMVLLLQLTGWRHPQTIDEVIPLDRIRIAVAIVAILIFALCFTPVPVAPLDLIRK
jgi:membrane-associated protease RseP (regulator of RpoE activity)